MGVWYKTGHMESLGCQVAPRLGGHKHKAVPFILLGVGKTSVARSIARALNRKVWLSKISVLQGAILSLVK